MSDQESFTITVTPDPTVNLASNKWAWASSRQDATLAASNVLDGNTRTRWSSQFSDPQWLIVSLGNSYTIDHVVLNWANAASLVYSVEVSNDVANWTQVYADINGNGGVDDIRFAPASAYFIRIYSFLRTTPRGVSLKEVEIYAASP